MDKLLECGFNGRRQVVEIRRIIRLEESRDGETGIWLDMPGYCVMSDVAYEKLLSKWLEYLA